MTRIATALRMGPSVGLQERLEDAIRLCNSGNEAAAIPLLDGLLADPMIAGAPELRDRAVLNRGAAIITLRRLHEPVPELRELLLRSQNPETCFLASFNIARAYEYAKEPRKALFYARLARDRADQLAQPTWIAWSRNQLGNALLSLSYLEEAAAEYRGALELLPAESLTWRALVTQNLGYTLVVSGRPHEASSLLLRSWRLATRDLGEASALLHLDLAYTYLEVGKARAALRHARRGLQLAEEAGFADEIKNGHFLAAQAHRAAADPSGAERHLAALGDWYPQTPFVAELLRLADLRPMINLRA